MRHANLKKKLKSRIFLYKGLFRIKWTDEVDYDLLHKIVAFNIEDKKDMDNF